MKCEKMQIQVDGRFEAFLANLGNPLKLNEMRTMKEANYNNFRQLISNFTGSPILRLIKENQEELGLDPDIYDLVYEGFWDLYSLHPQCMDLSARKLQLWIQKINLNVRPGTEYEVADQKADDDGEENKDDAEEVKPATPAQVEIEGADKIDSIDAVVKIKVPKVPKEPEQDDEGNDIPYEGPESDLEDIPFEDKCLQVNCNSDSQHIWVVNTLANKTLRTELSQEFRLFSDRLEHLEATDFNFRLEKEAQLFEEALLKLVEDSPDNKSNAPKVPVFDYRPKY